MATRILTLLFTIFFCANTHAQIIKVSPYLQDANPHSIVIMWETEMGEESTVEWGLSEALGNITQGSAETSVGDSRIHTVKIENLERFTNYFYRVKTGDTFSEIHKFKTPPFAEDNEPFRVIAMSDMQRDGSFPNKFQEIVQQGVIEYLNEEMGGDIVDNLALVMIPGDLVVNGNTYNSWEESFFTPSQDLFSQIPVYPVPGNHENDASYFFQYFSLPDNGSEGFEEHWWSKDYGNVRIVGMDSNSPYTNQTQLDWLQTLLDSTCDADSIDFVFAQLHHPHKSELWTPGESNFTGEVIEILENFSTDCGKPSIHLFGHTHGYSRGNSRDHKHLWINAATAGGAIDNWGEFPNFDYDEFSVSQDEYGFVSIEITSDEDPKLVVKRISRGDQDAAKDNELTDSVTVRLMPKIVDEPVAIYPSFEEVIPECVTLKAGDFSSMNESSLHGQSHWQVATTQVGFQDPVAESWKNYENWYFEVDTQAGDDLTDERIVGLEGNTDYWWRVRYRDRELNWSGWSTPAAFATGASTVSDNLLVNPGAEDSLSNWVIVEGVVETLMAGICDGVSPNSGAYYFAVGGLCEHSPVARLVQDVNVTAYADSIEAGNAGVNFGGYLSNFGGSDLPEMRLIFLDVDFNEIAVTSTLSTLSSSWTYFSEWSSIPEGTRTIRMELKGTRNAGTDNDSYFDDLFLKIGLVDVDCSTVSAIANQTFKVEQFNIVPNPVSTEGYVVFSIEDSSKVRTHVVDSSGSKMSCRITYEKDRIVIDSSNLPSGTYFFLIRESGVVVGTGSMVVVK